MQKKELVQYINNFLSDYPPAADLIPINSQNCIEALHDGVLFCYLMNKMSTTGPIIKQSDLKRTKATLFHKMDQVNKALQATKVVGLNIVGVRSESIVEKKQNVILGFINQVAKQKPGKKIENYNEKFKKQQYIPPQTQTQTQKEKQETPQPEMQQHKPQLHPKQQLAIKEQQFIIKQQQTEIIRHQQVQVHKVQQKVDHRVEPQPIQEPKEPEINKEQVQRRQRVLHMPINQNQSISVEAVDGYFFPHVQQLQIVALIGSIRRQSLNKGMVNALLKVSSLKFYQRTHFHIPDLSILPLFNDDLQADGKIPKAVYDLQKVVSRSAGLIVATPQYNGTFSGIIKNALDWLSKSYDSQNTASPLEGKKIGMISCSYLTENQIKDTKEIGETFHCNYFPENFYLDLRSGAFNMQTGNLINQAQINRLTYWYQEFSYFVRSTQANPQKQARFIISI